MLKLVSLAHELLFIASGMQCLSLRHASSQAHYHFEVIDETSHFGGRFLGSIRCQCVCLAAKVWFLTRYLEECPRPVQGSSILTNADCGRGMSYLVNEALGWGNAWAISTGAVFILFRKWSMAVRMAALLLMGALASHGVNYWFHMQA